jgi:hypothetical protein
MRIKLISILCLIILVPVKSIALEPVSEAHAMIYYQIPFSASKKVEKKHSFGFRMDHTSYEPGEMIEYQKLMTKTAAFDFKMGWEGVQGMYVSGVDYLQLYRLNRAAEDEGEDAEVESDDSDKSPGIAAKVGSDIANTVDELIEIVPLGFAIGGIIAIVLVTGAGG